MNPMSWIKCQGVLFHFGHEKLVKLDIRHFFFSKWVVLSKHPRRFHSSFPRNSNIY